MEEQAAVFLGHAGSYTEGRPLGLIDYCSFLGMTRKWGRGRRIEYGKSRTFWIQKMHPCWYILRPEGHLSFLGRFPLLATPPSPSTRSLCFLSYRNVMSLGLYTT